MLTMQSEIDKVELTKTKYEKEKEEIKGQWDGDVAKHKKEIADFKVKIRHITQEMSKTTFANASILKKMAWETGPGE